MSSTALAAIFFCNLMIYNNYTSIQCSETFNMDDWSLVCQALECTSWNSLLPYDKSFLPVPFLRGSLFAWPIFLEKPFGYAGAGFRIFRVRGLSYDKVIHLKRDMHLKTIPHSLSEKAVKKSPSEESYNPFEHRNVSKPNSDFGSLAHILKTSLGSGILAMPMAFKNSGLVLGTIGTITLGIICTHCVEMLVRSSQVLCKRIRVPTLTFAKTAEVAFEGGPPKGRRFSKAAGIIISVELISSFILGNTVYVVFISQSLQQIIEHYCNVEINIRYYILMLWIPLILMCLLRNLKSLVPFSVLANIFVFVSFGITLYFIFRNINPTENVHLVSPFSRWALFLSTVIFAIEGIGTVLSIENEMKNPGHFIGGRCNILYTSMSIVITVYTVIGFFGYLQYGEDTRGSITLNLPVHDKLAQAVKVLIALAIFFTYALQFYVPINLIWDMLKNKLNEKHHKYYNILVRVGLVSLTIILSVVVPNLEPIISLVGSICFSSLGLLLPSLIDTMVRWPNYGRWKWHLCKNIIIVIISIISLIAGSYTSIRNIIKEYS